MIFLYQNYGEVGLNQPIVMYSRCVCQIRYSHFYKAAPPAAKAGGDRAPR